MSFEAPATENNPLEVAKQRWGVDLANDQATLKKIAELQGKMPDIADLSNLWQDYQNKKGEAAKAPEQGVEEMKEAA